MSECQCELAGWCDRHQAKKTSRMVDLCRQHGDYWDAWEQGRGPGQCQQQKDDGRAQRIKQKVEREKRLRSWIAFFRSSGEAGLGDTAQRLMRLAKSRELKDDLRKILRKCSCNNLDAVAQLNSQYPYVN